MNATKTEINRYIETISKKVEDSIPEPNNIVVKYDISEIIPTTIDYANVIHFKYNLEQLKRIARMYKLKISGAKKQVAHRIYIFLHFSAIITRIQSVFRGWLQRSYNALHGPAYKNRSLCTNDSDFVTLDSLDTLTVDTFFSYEDRDGFMYGFDIASIHSLLMKGGDVIPNPYNRNPIPEEVFENAIRITQLASLLNRKLTSDDEEPPVELSNKLIVELRSLELFQNINLLGNYSDMKWFLTLNKQKLIRFMRELSDIFSFRAQLTDETKRTICPPHGDPFRNVNMQYIQVEEDMDNVRKHILEVLEKFVNSGIDTNSKSLGAYYVLAALTLVNESAAVAMPWLFQSVSYY
jgi:hypothetical protein